MCLRLFAGADEAEILFLHVGDQPDIAKIRRLVERLAGLDAHAFLHGLFDDDAIRGRLHSDTPRYFAGLAQPRDFIVGHIERAQPLQRSGCERAGTACASRPTWRRPCGRRQDTPARRRRDRGRRVRRALALAHRIAGGGDREPLDPARRFGCDGRKAPLIKLQRAGRANGSGEGRAHRHLLGAHAEHLHAGGADAHDTARIAGPFVGIDRDVVHAHGIFFRHR